MIRLLLPPRDEDPIAWANRHDRECTPVPAWPEASSIAIVAVVKVIQKKDSWVDAYLVETEEDLRKLVWVNPPNPILFFRVPTVSVKQCELGEPCSAEAVYGLEKQYDDSSDESN